MHRLQFVGAGEVLVTEVRAAPVGPDGMQSFAIAATRYGHSATTQFSDTVSGDPATLEALLMLKTPEQEAARRGKSVKELLPFWARKEA